MKAKQKGTHMNYGKQGVRSKQRALNTKSPKWGRKFALTGLKLLLAGCVGLGLSVAALGIGAFRGILEDTPQIRLSDVVASGQATIVYDCRGNEMDQYVGTNSNRIQVGWDVIPDHLGKAFVAIEDERFYSHKGVDLKRFTGAAFQYIFNKGDSSYGGSTITQQLIKNITNDDDYSIKRKIQEIETKALIDQLYNGSISSFILDYINNQRLTGTDIENLERVVSNHRRL